MVKTTRKFNTHGFKCKKTVFMVKSSRKLWTIG